MFYISPVKVFDIQDNYIVFVKIMVKGDTLRPPNNEKKENYLVWYSEESNVNIMSFKCNEVLRNTALGGFPVQIQKVSRVCAVC